MGELSTSAAGRTSVTRDRGGLFENGQAPNPTPTASETPSFESDDERDGRIAYVQEQKRLETVQLDQAIDRLGQLFFRGQVSNVGPQAESLVAARGIGLFGDRGRAFDAFA